MNLQQAMQAVIGRLEAGGVRATDDPRDVNPPVIHLRPPALEYRFGKDCWEATWTAWAIVGDPGRHAALAQHSALIEQAQTALGGAIVSGRPDDAMFPDGSTLPIYILTWTERIR